MIRPPITTFLVGCFFGFFVFKLLHTSAAWGTAQIGAPSISQVQAGRSTSTGLLLTTLAVQAFRAALAGCVVIQVANLFSRLATGSLRGAYLTLQPLLAALAACSIADPEMSNLSALLGECKRSLRKAYKRRNTVPLVSHRRRILKRHAAVVVAALQGAESRLDVDPILARAELAGLLHKIAERFMEGRVGALLDDAELVGVRPSLNWEPLRLAVLVTLLPLSSWMPTALGLPDGIRASVTIGGPIVLGSALYGRRWPEAAARARAVLSAGGSST